MSKNLYKKTFLIMGNTSKNIDDIAVRNSTLLYISFSWEDSISIASSNKNNISLDGFYQYVFIIPANMGSQVPIANQSALLFKYDSSLGINTFCGIINFSFNIDTVLRQFEIRAEEYEGNIREYVAEIHSIKNVNAIGAGYSKSEAVIALSNMLGDYIIYQGNKENND